MNEIKIQHPEHGHVIFTEPTPRQLDILNDYIKLKNKQKSENNYQKDWEKAYLND